MRSLVLLSLSLASVSCSRPFPGGGDDASAVGSAVGSDPAAIAERLLRECVAAHGGDVYRKFRDVNVSYDGEWARMIRRIQPDIVDHRFRGKSEERILVGKRVSAQRYIGEGGEKLVVRTAKSVSVAYDGVSTEETGTLQASAMVADAYEMFLFGPSFLLRYGQGLRLMPDAVEGGTSYRRIALTLQPGLGFATSEPCEAWIDLETGLLFRVHFTVSGVDSAAGGHVDTTFLSYIERDGHQWPAEFEERLRGPFTLPVHDWYLTGLDTDRGYPAGAITGTKFVGAAAAPARALR